MRESVKITVCVVFCLILESTFVRANENNGYLKVRASIRDVALVVDGQQIKTIGTQWDFVELRSGTHVVKATKEHYQPQSKKVSIESGRVTSIQFDFEQSVGFRVKQVEDVSVVKGYGDMTVVTDIPGATLRLNGQPVQNAVTPVTVEHLAQGEWTVEAEIMGKSRTKKIVIQPGQLHVVRLFFDPEKQKRFCEEEDRRREQEVRKQREAEFEQRRKLEARKLAAHLEHLISQLTELLRQNRFDAALATYGMVRDQGTSDYITRAAKKMVAYVNQFRTRDQWQKIDLACRLTQADPVSSDFKKLFEQTIKQPIGQLRASPGRRAEVTVKDLQGRQHKVTLTRVSVNEVKRRKLMSGRTDVVSASCQIQIDGRSVQVTAENRSNRYSLTMPQKILAGFKFVPKGHYSKSTSGLIDGALTGAVGLVADTVSLGKAGYISEAVEKKSPSVSVQVYLDLGI